MSFARLMGLAITSVVAVVILAALAGCVGVPTPSDLPPLPKSAVMPSAPVSHLAPYRLQIGDVLDIKIMSNPELNDQVTVRPDGMISTMIATDVPAYGHTTRQVQRILEKRSREILRAPKISIIVRSFAPTRIYVLGEVRSPGEFITVGPNLTLLQAIARAGGISNSAQPDNIVIVRRNADDEPESFSANYASAATGEDPASDVRLAPYDVVFVPRSGVADAYLNYQQYFQQFVPDSINAQVSHNF